MSKQIGKMVLDSRTKLDLSRIEAGKKLGLSPNYLGLIERGYPTHISDEVVKKLRKIGVRAIPRAVLEKHNNGARKDAAKWRKVMAKAHSKTKTHAKAK